MPRSINKQSRRAFLAAGAAALGPLVLPSGVLARPGRPGANDRVVTGHIGLGARGRALLRPLRENAAALCDVDRNHLHQGASLTRAGMRLFTDYRELLEEADVDAVVIATPDHWHALQTVHACQAGKDVYVEAPVCRTLAEGQAMIAAASRYGAVVQAGWTGYANAAVAAVTDNIAAGQLGDVGSVACYGKPNPVGGNPDYFSGPPEELDWDLWLGQARQVPYNPDRVHNSFRWMLDLGGGQIRNQGVHVFHAVLATLGAGQLGRVHVNATGTPPPKGLWDCPTTMEVQYQLAGPPVDMSWSQGADAPPVQPFGAAFRGAEGDVVLVRGDAQSTCTLSGGEGEKTPAPPVPLEDVLDAWLVAVRDRKSPKVTIEAGVRAATLCILGNLSYRLGRSLEWDPEAGRFVNAPQADRLIAEPGRGPWRF